jgi:hypothetical protein
MAGSRMILSKERTSFHKGYPKVKISKGNEKSIGNIVMTGDTNQDLEFNENEEEIVKKNPEVFIIKCKVI